VLRVRGWSAERSRTSSSWRLALLADPTTFLAALTTSEGLEAYARVDPLSAPDVVGRELARRDEAIPDLAALRRRVRAGCLDREADLANVLGVHVTVLTADRRILIVRRRRGAWLAGERLNTAANGALELGGRIGLSGGDFDADGLVDVVGAGLREAREELGELQLDRDNVTVRALGLTTVPDPAVPGEAAQVSPWVILEARTPRTFAEIPQAQFVTASRFEGAHEVGGEFYGVSLRAGRLAETVRWLRDRYRSGELTPGGAVTSLLALLHVARPDDLARFWADGAAGPVELGAPDDDSAAVVFVAADA
jgi:8-oxo-dGTP pyrophosphatase MutT (NUDIX family)